MRRERSFGWRMWIGGALAVGAVACAPAPGEPYEYEPLSQDGAVAEEKGLFSRRPVGGSCGNDGDTWTIDEGDCTYTVTTSCKWQRATSPDGRSYKYCGCVDLVIGKDCPEIIETPFGF